MKIVVGYVGVILAFALISVALAQSKPATEATKAANTAVLEELPLSDQRDFANAKRGFRSSFVVPPLNPTLAGFK